MIDLSELTFDYDLAQPFTIMRASGGFGLGGWKQAPRAAVPGGTMAIIQPATSEDLDQVPEGDRVKGSMSFISNTQMFETHSQDLNGAGAATSDTITWRGQVYRVQKVWPWGDQGFWKAVGCRVSGA